MAAATPTWRQIPCSRRTLRLDLVLQCGQAFGWRGNARGEWVGVLAGRVWRLRQDEEFLYYQVYNKETRPQGTEEEIKPEPEEDSKEGMIKLEDQTPPPTTMAQDVKTPRIKLEPPDVKSETRDDDPNPWQPPGRHHGHDDDDEDESKLAAILRDYFQLDVDTAQLYKRWSSVDPYFEERARDFWGVRMLRQDPAETLFAMICATNTKLRRTTTMLRSLCQEYGEYIATVDGEEFHSFPSVAVLAQNGVEERLTVLMFGYHAGYVASSARRIVANEEALNEEALNRPDADAAAARRRDWLLSLRTENYENARQTLQTLHGVGRKVADCVCLMSLDKPEAVPVDTHIREIAYRAYLPRPQQEDRLTDTEYRDIANRFRQVFGEYAGWAQAVLFAAELPQIQAVTAAPQ